jgi:hypothetical protein
MNVHRLEGPPPVDLARALDAFEAEFTYPLGPTQTFHIAHGPDYSRFFRAMGDAACFVAEDRGRVIGTLAGAVRRLGLPDGSEKQVVYFGDLKVTAAARHGRVLYRVIRAAQTWAERLAEAAFFSVVMDGTRATPDGYTGRVGLPAFAVVGKTIVLRLQAADNGFGERYGSDPATGEHLYRELSVGRYCMLGGNPAERSEMTPRWLIAPDGMACGRLEDTRRAKRLLASDGAELISAHLSCFAFQRIESGISLLLDAARRAARLGCPALFVAVPELDAHAVRRALTTTVATVAPATVYGAGIEARAPWNVNTAEI